MTPNDKLIQINQQLHDKCPAAKPAAPASTPNTAVLKARIKALKDKLSALEAELRRVGGKESRLVRMIKLS
jgi:hypothetical protein